MESKTDVAPATRVAPNGLPIPPLDTSVEYLDIDTQSKRLLIRLGYTTIGEALELPDDYLKSLPNVDAIRMMRFKRALYMAGFWRPEPLRAHSLGLPVVINGKLYQAGIYTVFYLKRASDQKLADAGLTKEEIALVRRRINEMEAARSSSGSPHQD